VSDATHNYPALGPSWRARLAAVTLYGGLALLLTGILLEALAAFLPNSLAVRVGFNSEGIFLTLLLCGWIQFVRPRLVRSAHERWRVLAVAAALGAVGVHLYGSDYPSRFKTLNESFVAAAFVVVYLHLRRPLRREVPLAIAGVVLALMVLGQGISSVTSFAESLAVFLLLPAGLDVVDRAILQPNEKTSAALRFGWYGLLVALPIMSSVLYHGGWLEGVAGEAVRYAVRLHEGFIAVLLMQLYFAVILGRRGPTDDNEGSAGQLAAAAMQRSGCDPIRG
jgi:hypothetical protein